MEPLLEVKNLRTTFRSDWGQKEALNGVSFAVSSREIVCIVGESGSGKSVTALSLMGLLPRNGKVTEGQAVFMGQDLLQMKEQELDRVRGGAMSMIFQDAISALNPAFTVGNQLAEAVTSHRKLNAREVQEECIELLNRVGLPEPEKMLKRYPYSLSGGMKQRVMIAMALAGNPKLLIADEPTTALDVTIQAQIMQLLRKLCDESGLSVILITHDIGLVAQMADRVLVMYAGQIVEQSYVEELFLSPDHPYTQGLMQAVPSIYDDSSRRLVAIPGSVPEAYQDIKGCRFAGRCPYRVDACALPQVLSCYLEAGRTREDFPHCVRCHRAAERELPEFHPVRQLKVGDDVKGDEEFLTKRVEE